MRSFFLLLLLAPALPAQEMDRPRERSEWFFQQRAYPHGYVRAGDRLKALREADRMRSGIGRALAASPTQWTLIGPQPTSPQPGSTSGRVTALAVDPRDANVVYLGAAEGGVWKTGDGGLHWTSLSDALPTLATGSIALDPVNPNIVYVGTGEENNCGDCYFGAGIFKSADGGATWTQLPGPFIDPIGRGARIGSLAVHPTNGQVLLAAVNLSGASGLYRSTDAAVSWTLVQRGNAGAVVLFDPTDPNIAYGTLYGTGVYKSVNAGVAWTLVNGTGTNVLPVKDASRIEIALAPSSPLTLYAGLAATADGTLLGLFKTVDGGQNWNPLPNTPDYCRPQCVYDNVLGVDPANPNVVYAGGISLYRSLDGGASWTSVSSGAGGVSIHVDQHALAFAAGGPKLYAGNDGGVYSAADRMAVPLTWSNLNDTLSITEFYPATSIHPADVNTTFAGTQDNGTQRYSGNLLWDRVTCGDGGWTIIDSAQPAIVYGTCQRIDIRKSVNNGNSWSATQIRGIDPTDHGAFIPPFVADPSNSQRLYFGTFRVYQSNDGAGSWVAVSPNLGGNFNLTSIAVAPGDPGIAYAGTSGGRVFVTTNLGAGPASTWTDRTAGLPVRFVTRVVVDPSGTPGSSATAYVTLSGFSGISDTQGHVFKTANGGATWADISANLPNIPVSDIIIDPDLANTCYVATDAGVFRSSDGGGSWSPLGTGMPRVVVMGLALHRPSRILRAATHGRSMWDIQVPLPAGFNSAPGLSLISPASANPGNAVALTVNGMGFVPGSVVRWKGPGNLSSNRPTTFASATQLAASLSAAELAVAGIAQVTVFNPAPGGGSSNAMNFTVAAPPAVTSGGTVNAASFGNQPPSAGSIVSTFGSNLAFSSAAAGGLPLPLALEGVVVRYNSTAAPLFFVSPLQVNYQIPWELAGLTQVSLAVSAGAVNGNSQVVRLANFGPGIFTTTQTGSGQGAVLIAGTGSPAAPAGTLPGARPVTHGEAISIFATGLGAVTNRPASGLPALADPLSTTTTTPVVTIGDKPAPVIFSGLAPGLVGVYQVNALVPEDAPSGSVVPLVLTIGGVVSNIVMIAVQ